MATSPIRSHQSSIDGCRLPTKPASFAFVQSTFISFVADQVPPNAAQLPAAAAENIPDIVPPPEASVAVMFTGCEVPVQVFAFCRATLAPETVPVTAVAVLPQPPGVLVHVSLPVTLPPLWVN
jgi:hypothetical protein